MMKFYKSREISLKNKINNELSRKNPDIEEIMLHIKQYEQDNLTKIEKLNRIKLIETRKIKGALRSTIQTHGPITMVLIGSAVKRIYGALLSDTQTKKENILIRIIKKIMTWKK